MFPQLKKVNNESGIVLFIVLMMAILIMLFSAGIVGQSLNEIKYAQQQTDQIVCDQLTKGSFWNAYAPGMAGFTSGQMVTVPIPGSGRNYNITITQGLTSSNGITNYTVACNYDTFQ